MVQANNPIRVLVVDDSRDIRDFVSEYVLVPNGYETILARDGAEGLRKALMDSPDLILLDYEMPRMSGLEVLEALEARSIEIPVILMTSHGSEEIAAQVFRVGAKDYIIKPFTIEDLLLAMQQVLHEVQLRREKAALMEQLKRANRLLQQRLTELNTLYQIGKSVTALMPLEVLLERIADAALYITRAEECVLLLNDPETGRLVEKVRKQRADGRGSFAASKGAQKVARSADNAAAFFSPFRVGPKTIGALGVNNKITLRALSEHDKQMLRTLADYAAIAIENVRLLRQVEQTKEREKQAIQNLFERYVAPSVVKELIRQSDKVTLGGIRQELSVLFADIRGFTQFSTRTTPEVLVEVLNRHITAAAEAILVQEGTLDKFMGDQVLAFFNAPLLQHDHALRAVRAALAIHRAIASLHHTLPPPYRLHFGVGISVGEAVVGNIGTPQLMNFTIIGEAVNLGQRLQTQADGGQVLICQRTYDLVRNRVHVRPLGPVELKGLPTRDAFELLGLRE